jgi:hypothetical protein
MLINKNIIIIIKTHVRAWVSQCRIVIFGEIFRSPVRLDQRYLKNDEYRCRYRCRYRFAV